MTDKGTLIVTGASRGIGAHVAVRATREGYRVVGLSRNATSVDGFGETLACDVGDAGAVRAIARTLKGERVAGIVNAAGIAAMNLALTTPTETVRRVIDTNLTGTIIACQHFAPLMIRGSGGRIVNFSSIAAPLALAGESVYAASKAGVEAFTRSFAREMAGFNITVNCIAPGPVRTDLIAKVPDGKIAEIVARQIIARMATTDDIWDLVSLLLDKRAAMITGEVLHAGGV